MTTPDSVRQATQGTSDRGAAWAAWALGCFVTLTVLTLTEEFRPLPGALVAFAAVVWIVRRCDGLERKEIGAEWNAD